jgi:hypothetical protein
MLAHLAADGAREATPAKMDDWNNARVQSQHAASRTRRSSEVRRALTTAATRLQLPDIGVTDIDPSGEFVQLRK